MLRDHRSIEIDKIPVCDSKPNVHSIFDFFQTKKKDFKDK